MKNIFFILSFILLISCSSSTKNTDSDSKKEAKEDVQLEVNRFEFITTKTEQKGENTNVMELYCPITNFDLGALKLLCEKQKNNFNGFFLFIVVFDNKENAAFPTDPFTANYGMEDKKMKHIKAYYTFNSVNSYSKLAVYENNMYESVAQEIDI